MYANPPASFRPRHDATVERLLRPGRRDRLAARIRRHHLDSALARGVDPARSPALAARAAALTAAATRAELAESLDRVVRRAHEPARSHRLTPARTSIAANRAALAELAAILRGDRPLYARGLAMLAGLLSDGAGPLYARRDGGAALSVALREARAALAG